VQKKTLKPVNPDKDDVYTVVHGKSDKFALATIVPPG
jgi:hypothetical protein